MKLIVIKEGRKKSTEIDFLYLDENFLKYKEKGDKVKELEIKNKDKWDSLEVQK